MAVPKFSPLAVEAVSMLSPPPRASVQPSPSRPGLLRRATTGIGFGTGSMKHTRSSTGSYAVDAGAGAGGVSVVTLDEDIRGLFSPPMTCRPSIADDNSGRVSGTMKSLRGGVGWRSGGRAGWPGLGRGAA